MAEYWISTIWPLLPGDEQFTFHVYLKSWRKTVPAKDDVVYFRQSKSAPTFSVTRILKGKQSAVALTAGWGGIMGRAVVRDTTPIRIPPYPTDVAVYDFGNLKDWDRVLRCRHMQSKPVMDLAELKQKLDVDSVRALSLCPLKEQHVIRELEGRFVGVPVI